MLSYDTSEKPLALSKNGDVIYYHKHAIENFDFLTPDPKDKLSKEDQEKVYRAIKGTKDEHFPSKALSYFHKAKVDMKEKLQKTISVKDEKDSYFPYPLNEAHQRQFLILTGASGSGKSYWCSQYMKIYHQMFPKNKIIIFSKKNFDPAYEEKNIDLVEKKILIRIPLDDEFLEENLDTKDFKNTLVVFDDIENIPNKAIQKKVYALKDNLSQTGRVEGIYIILCNHMGMNFKETRIDLGEADGVVVFQSTNPGQRDNLLIKYCGLSKDQVLEVGNLLKNSRWCFVKKTHPSYIVTEYRVTLF